MSLTDSENAVGEKRRRGARDDPGRRPKRRLVESDSKYADSIADEKEAGNESKRCTCNVCGRSFAKRGDLTRHYRVHTGEKPYKCPICHKAFSRKGNMETHMRTHSGSSELPHVCPICHKGFVRKCALTTHMKTHNGTKPYHCRICKKRFMHRSSLAYHENLHSEAEKPFKCKHCGKSFAVNNVLTRHLRIHAEVMPFVCEVCGYSTYEKGNLTRHLKIHNKGEIKKVAVPRSTRQAVQCSVCSEPSYQLPNARGRIRRESKPLCHACDRWISNVASRDATVDNLLPYDDSIQPHEESCSEEEKRPSTVPATARMPVNATMQPAWFAHQMNMANRMVHLLSTQPAAGTYQYVAQPVVGANVASVGNVQWPLHMSYSGLGNDARMTYPGWQIPAEATQYLTHYDPQQQRMELLLRQQQR